jgi:hypothetical protein
VPERSVEAMHGWRYASVETLGRDATIAMLAVPTVSIAVSELLP